MIALVNPVHPEHGYALDMSCPAIVCDACGDLIDSDHPGMLMYHPIDTRSQWHVHKGVCNRYIEQRAGVRLYSRELDAWVSQLAYGYANPIVGHAVEMDDGTVYSINKVVQGVR